MEMQTSVRQEEAIGNEPVPTRKMRQKIGSRAKTIDFDEYGTSISSCCCHTQMEGGSHKIKQMVSDFMVCGVVLYTSCSRKVWDRNTSAAINVLKIFLRK